MLNDTLELPVNFNGHRSNQGVKQNCISYNRDYTIIMNDGLAQKTVSGKSPVKTNSDVQQNNTLNKFMIKNFIRGIMLKHVYLFIPDDVSGIADFNNNNIFKFTFDKDKTPYIFETILKRAHSTILQFKKVCCIIIKFLECCKNETNYMKHLKYDLHRLIVVAFVLSVPNVNSHEGNKIMNRETCYKLYSKISGLTIEEITNCCSIVRPVLIRRSRKQKGISRSPINDHLDNNLTITSLNNDNPTNILEGNGNVARFSSIDSPYNIDENLMSYNRFLSVAQKSIDVHSANYNIGTNLPSLNDDESIQSHGSYSHSSESPSFTPASINDVRYNISSLHELNQINSSTRRQHHNHNHHYRNNSVKDNSPLSNGYIMNTEIEQFNEMGKKLVLENFTIV
ncbi:similar to Saccharomyces cerevisiae YPL039W Putative protein of unknown function [Maudiozyma saulgeensis]|uniref:Uncharacterized protein n=1 Tax=Maudiozyma saulgeensis TaxID=1789683 RepID=A0A1X7R8S6_9SACH|nr:similar to Saccharomyces cerevisiae YPL039W Putative protein of unknown function [Kazachstania saulgeensis]